MIKIILISILLFSSCVTNKVMQDSSAIIDHWVHSFEEDEKGIKVFRPKDYNFKPSRGREEIIIMKDGKLRYRPLSPNDEPIFYEGTWSINGNILLLEYEKKKKSYRIKEMNKGLLKLM